MIASTFFSPSCEHSQKRLARGVFQAILQVRTRGRGGRRHHGRLFPIYGGRHPTAVRGGRVDPGVVLVVLVYGNLHHLSLRVHFQGVVGPAPAPAAQPQVRGASLVRTRL